jgi:hypothetical protein
MIRTQPVRRPGPRRTQSTGGSMNCPDGNYEHRWIHLGEGDGFSAYECGRCGAELHDHGKEEA